MIEISIATGTQELNRIMTTPFSHCPYTPTHRKQRMPFLFFFLWFVSAAEVVHANALSFPAANIPSILDEKAKIALDVQCGMGDTTAELSRRLGSSSNAWTVVGIDSDPDKVALAKQKHPSVSFLVGDVSQFPSASFDKVQVHAGRMLYIHDKWNFGGELARILRPGGTFDLFDFTLSHALVRELFDMEETFRKRYFCGWSSYDPVWHRHMLAQRRLQFHRTVFLPDADMVHTTFVK
jgi:SAM-dependent methyltransferase